jgi:hypothetical protein
MKNMKKIFVLIILFSGIVASSFAQVTATATAAATIITPISINKTSNMAFGNISINNTIGTVTLPATTSPNRTFTGGVTLPNVPGTVTAAKFDVTGANSTTYAISLPSTAVQLSSGSDHMNIDTFLTDIGLTGTLSTTGMQSFFVGSTIHVGASQPAGQYTGSFSVTINYN